MTFITEPINFYIFKIKKKLLLNRKKTIVLFANEK